MDPKAILQKHNLRNTSVRCAILHCMFNAETPLSIEDIKLYLKHHHIRFDGATIYRTINIFWETGIVRQIDFHEGKFRYEMADLPHHHHIVCTTCGLVQNVHDCLKEKVNHVIEEKTGFSVTSHALEFFGICKRCRQRKI